MSDRKLILVDGASHVKGVRGWFGLVRRWPAMRRELTESRGYVAHRIYLVGPTTIGLMTWWESRKALMQFAHGETHHEIWEWAVKEDRTKGGWLATYELTGGGPLWGSGTPLAETFADHMDFKPAEAPVGCPVHHTK